MFSSRERRLLAVVEKLSHMPPRINAADIDRLRQDGWDDRAISQIVTIVAYFHFVNRMMIGLDVELEPELTDLARALLPDDMTSRQESAE